MSVIARLLALGLLALTLAACAVHRPALKPEELEKRRAEYIQTMRGEWSYATRKAVRRMHAEWEDYRTGKVPERSTFDVLILSGGGDYGAFGAGFLRGWGNARNGPSRPDFDVVTGVSTGALIAPFAFIGDDDAYGRIENLYREPKKDWVQIRDLLFFLPGRESFLDTKGLQRDICEQINMDIIHRIAQRSREGRVLAIGTTNLDLGITTAWRLSAECEKAADCGDPTRVHKILLASSAIPAAFPPVVIDDALYVDGGTTSNILVQADMRSPNSVFKLLKRRYPDMPMPTVRYWVIINNQMGAAPQVVQPSWPSITEASVATAIRSSTIGALRNLDLLVRYIRLAENMNTELYFVSIPDDWRPPKPGIFEKETMQSLADLGHRLGASGEAWQVDLYDAPRDLDVEDPEPAR